MSIFPCKNVGLKWQLFILRNVFIPGENVPVTAPVEVPNEKCYKKPRKVCQTLVSTKPKVVTAKVLIIN